MVSRKPPFSAQRDEDVAVALIRPSRGQQRAWQKFDNDSGKRSEGEIIQREEENRE